ncbi:MAG TPA: hypothetical protein VFX15_09605 [Actinomycetes bacterium]|nr:hypothetical protein [Actinomycetes bacterium]
MAQLDDTTEIRALDEFWCSDCLERSLFERVVSAAAGSEWACTSCGAAYFDAIDLVVDPGSGRLTASVRSA